MDKRLLLTCICLLALRLGECLTKEVTILRDMPGQENYSLLPAVAELLRKPEPHPATGARGDQRGAGP